MSLELAVVVAAINGDTLSPKIATNSKYKHWVSAGDMDRCALCRDEHGKIWLLSEEPTPKPPAHPHCRCTIKQMQSIAAGTATINRVDGADWTLKHTRNLPNRYITKEAALTKGWKPGKWPSDSIPGMMIKRNGQRILWSNDGLIFVTYDHYKTFYEIV